MTSIKTIAQATGVSVATVSRVLNNPEYRCRKENLAEQIRQVARELAYVPDENARYLQAGSGTDKVPGNKTYVVDILLFRFHSLEEDPFLRSCTVMWKRNAINRTVFRGGF